MYYFIEPMVEDDIAHVQEIERTSRNVPWSAQTYRRELRNAVSSRYIVARASDTLPPPRPAANGSAPRRNGLIQRLFGTFLQAAPLHPGYPLVGYGGLWRTIDEAHITTIAVAPAYQRRGLGELLLNGLLDEALDMGASYLTLEVRVSNMPAQNLYLKYGFAPAGRRVRYYSDNGEDALIMWTEAITSPAYQGRLRDLRQQLFARLRAQADDLPQALADTLQAPAPPATPSPSARSSKDPGDEEQIAYSS